ncbi:MipA/OmpV family protein [Alteromonas sp. DY56-G5]|uniref:MipA/OmpV family protein n=1 Tax=Alteromonas sp. DY56-G5 TaxID=2967128 RepID=UPI00352B79DD
MLSENLQLVEAESDDLLGINVVKQIYLSACIFFLVITSFLHKQAVANDYETFSGKESLCCSVEEKAELNFTLYLRMDALFKNELFIDPGQEDFIDYIDISLGIDVYYDRFFIEANNQANRSNRGSSIGYRLVDDVDYQVDFLLGQSYLDGLSEDTGNLLRNEPSEELRGIRDRDDEINQGFRITRYGDNQAWWIDVAGDPFNITHGGWIVDGYYAQAYQVYNWELHAGIGATLFSNEVVDYHAGISLEEATANRPVYEAGFGGRLSLDVSAQYPLSQDWVFVSGFTYKYYSEAFSDSPLYQRNQHMLFSLGVMYVW